MAAVDKLNKSPLEYLDRFNELTGNPLIRALAMATIAGGGTYLGGRYLAHRKAKNLSQQYQDPRMQEAVYQSAMQRGNRLLPWLSGAVAVGAGALPLMGQDWDKAFKMGKPTVPLFYNQYGNTFGKPQSQNSILWKTSMEKEADHPYEFGSNPPYEDPDNALIGKDFKMTSDMFRPPNFDRDMDIPSSTLTGMITHPKTVSVLGIDATKTIASGIGNATEGRSGLISTENLAQGLIDTAQVTSRAVVGGIAGAAGAYGLASILGTLGTLPTGTKMALTGIGGVGGAIANSGFITTRPIFG